MQDFSNDCKIIHQIFISKMIDPNEDAQLNKNREMFESFYPDHKYILWRSSDIQKFLLKEYPYLLEKYNTLQAYAAKADLARLIIVNHFGGWYYDFYTEPLLHVDVSELEMVFFRDIPEHNGTSFAVANGLFYSIKNNIVLKTGIELILRNIESKYYGGNPLCASSVVPFGRAIAINGYNGKHLIGQHKDIDGKRVFIFNDGTVFANGKSISGGKIDIEGTNNYNTIWNERNYYGEIINEVISK